jgi:hypothetical protein
MLMAMGMKDPVVFSMVDRALTEGFTNPRLESFDGDSIRISPGAETLVISVDKSRERYRLILTCEKTA